jgi:hypothetical protein
MEGIDIENSQVCLSNFAYFQRLNRLREFFLRYETPETKQCIAELEKLIAKWEEEGAKVEIFLEGSMGFGQVSSNETRDLDLVYMSDCTDDFEKKHREIFSVIQAQFPNIHAVEMDVIDLRLVEIYVQWLESGQSEQFVPEAYAMNAYTEDLMCRKYKYDLSSSNQTMLMARHFFERFIDFFWINRSLGQNPIANDLFQRACQFPEDLIVATARKKAIWQDWGLTNATDYRRSFNKYIERLKRRGISIPEYVSVLIEELLRENDQLDAEGKIRAYHASLSNVLGCVNRP